MTTFPKVYQEYCPCYLNNVYTQDSVRSPIIYHNGKYYSNLKWLSKEEIINNIRDIVENFPKRNENQEFIDKIDNLIKMTNQLRHEILKTLGQNCNNIDINP